jgi:arsenate reductase
MTTLYGIPNCDSVKKARKWLETQDIAYTFVNVRENTPPNTQIARWVSVLGPEKMVNKRSTTWKNMSEGERSQAQTGDTVSVLLANPTLIKRPVLEHNDVLDVGFKAEAYAAYFSK